jgi:hypothetical protein
MRVEYTPESTQKGLLSLTKIPSRKDRARKLFNRMLELNTEIGRTNDSSLVLTLSREILTASRMIATLRRK